MKGGYKIKDGFYIKDDCKNNEDEGMIDENGYILDPILFEKIPEHQIVQLSDGYCYDKQNSQQLLTVINRSNRLPFGHDVKSADRRKLRRTTSSSAPSVKLVSPPSISITPEEIEIIPRRRTRRINIRRRPRRTRPTLIIESDSTEVIESDSAAEIPQEIANAPQQAIESMNSDELLDLYLTNREEFNSRLGIGRGKRKSKKRRNKKNRKSNRKTRKYLR